MLQFQLVYFHLSETMFTWGRFKLVTYYTDLVDICFHMPVLGSRVAVHMMAIYLTHPPPSEIASLKKGSTLPRKSLNLGLIQPLFRWGHVEQSWCILHHDHWQTCSEHPCNSRAARFFGVSWPCQTTRMTSSGLPKNSMTQHGATFQHPTLHSHHQRLLGTMHTKGRKGTGTRDLLCWLQPSWFHPLGVRVHILALLHVYVFCLLVNVGCNSL